MSACSCRTIIWMNKQVSSKPHSEHLEEINLMLLCFYSEEFFSATVFLFPLTEYRQVQNNILTNYLPPCNSQYNNEIVYYQFIPPIVQCIFKDPWGPRKIGHNDSVVLATIIDQMPVIFVHSFIVCSSIF